MYTFLILDKDKYLICSLRVTERGKCGHSILRCKKYTKVKKSDLYTLDLPKFGPLKIRNSSKFGLFLTVQISNIFLKYLQ